MTDCIYLQLMDKTHEKYQMVVDDIGDVVFYDEYTEFVYGFHRGVAGRWYAVDRWSKGVQHNWNMGNPAPIIEQIKSDLEYFRKGELPPDLPENCWMGMDGSQDAEYLKLNEVGDQYEIVINLEEVIEKIQNSPIPERNRQLFCCWW